MKNKLLILSSALFIGVTLTGCFNAIPELSDEDEVKVVRYMADAVLAHDTNYQARLLDEKEKEEALLEEAKMAEELKKIEEEEKIEKEKKEEANTPDKTDVSFAAKSYGVDEINDYLGIDGVEFEFAGEEIVDKYPKSSESIGFAFTASDTNKLMIVKMNVSNVSSEDVYVDFVSANPKFRAVINDNTKVSPSKVPLSDVLNFFSENIEAGGVRQLVLIYEIPEDTSIDKIDLNLSAFGKDAIKINLK